MKRHHLAALLVAILCLPACGILEGIICDGCKPPEPPEPEVCEPMGCPRELDNPLQCDGVSGACVPCPALPGAIWNTEAGATTCSTPERPVKAWAPTAECPSLTVSCDPGPDPGPGPTPPGAACSFPQGYDPQLVGGDNSGRFSRRVEGGVQLEGVVNEVMTELTGCHAGSDCRTEMSPDDWMHAVIGKLQERGLCAGRHVDTSPGGSDEIAVNDNCNGPGNVYWDGFKVYNYGGGKVIWSGFGAERPAWKLPSSVPASACGVSEPPPTEPPTEPPTSSSCPAPVTPKVDKFQGPHPHGQWFDTTPLFYGNSTTRWDGVVITDYCRDTLQPNKLHCPARPECGPGVPPDAICHDRFACERVGVSGRDDGGPLWRTDGELILNPDNIFQASCSRCSWIEICAADGTKCSRYTMGS